MPYYCISKESENRFVIVLDYKIGRRCATGVVSRDHIVHHHNVSTSHYIGCNGHHSQLQPVSPKRTTTAATMGRFENTWLYFWNFRYLPMAYRLKLIRWRLRILPLPGLYLAYTLRAARTLKAPPQPSPLVFFAEAALAVSPVPLPRRPARAAACHHGGPRNGRLPDERSRVAAIDAAVVLARHGAALVLSALRGRLCHQRLHDRVRDGVLLALHVARMGHGAACRPAHRAPRHRRGAVRRHGSRVRDARPVVCLAA